jgi:ribosomal protein L24
MKKILFLVASMISAQSALACIDNSGFTICPGDVVYKGTVYSQGATVVAINPYRNTVTVRSVYAGNLNTENVTDLDITRGCIDRVCVGDKVYKGTEFSQGARVLALNPNSRTATVQSIYAGNLVKSDVSSFDLVSGCIRNICVGDKVYKGTQFSQGAMVISINPGRNTATVQSVYAGNLSTTEITSLEVTHGCIDGICVGDVVYKGSTYSQGARVLAINYYSRTVTVQSVYAGNLATENPRDLDVTDYCNDYDERIRRSSFGDRN